MYSKMKLMLLCFIYACCFCFSNSSGSRPHIVYILADDLGWNDVSFHGSPDIPTPNIDALAASGVVLHNFYMAPQCTPSRGSLMTGMYPFNIGLQHYVIEHGKSIALPLQFKILPQYLKSLGYSTNLIGKWHLGHFKKEYTPNNRGFDRFFGYWAGHIDYFDYTFYSSRKDFPFWGVDLHDNQDIVMDVRGKYATDLFTEKAVDIIQNHNTSEPMFLLLSGPAPHSGNSYAPLQVLPEDLVEFKHIKNVWRRMYAGMVKRLDDSVGTIFQALDAKDMIKNSIIIFSSDNGGSSDGSAVGQASNWPLRGEKMHLWEGGIRVPAVVWSPLLKLQEPVINQALMHVSDWLPTLYHAAGGDVKDLGEIDGKNLWPYLLTENISPRKDLVLNIDPVYPMAAIRAFEYKLLQGNFPKRSDLWYALPDGILEKPFSLDDWVWSKGSLVMDILKKSGWWLLKNKDQWRKGLTIDCGKKVVETTCDPILKPCLFNIVNDPCEFNDIAYFHPEVVRDMQELIELYNSTSLPPYIGATDLSSDPACYGFGIVSWQDQKYQNECWNVS